VIVSPQEFESSANATDMSADLLDEQAVDGIIASIAALWPHCRLVWGRPRHSESNGGVERFNQTFQLRLHAWMKVPVPFRPSI
jgi:hypothetical protein